MAYQTPQARTHCGVAQPRETRPCPRSEFGRASENTLIRWPFPSQAAPAKRDANRGLASMCDLFGVMASSDPCQPPGVCTEIWQSLPMRTGYLHSIFLPRCLCSGIFHCLCFSPGLCLSRRLLCLPPETGPCFLLSSFSDHLDRLLVRTARLQSMYAPSRCPCKARWVLASILCTGCVCAEIWQSPPMGTGYLHSIFLPRCLRSGISIAFASPQACAYLVDFFASRLKQVLVFGFRLFQIILIDSWSELQDYNRCMLHQGAPAKRDGCSPQSYAPAGMCIGVWQTFKHGTFLAMRWPRFSVWQRFHPALGACC